MSRLYVATGPRKRNCLYKPLTAPPCTSTTEFGGTLLVTISKEYHSRFTVACSAIQHLRHLPIAGGEIKRFVGGFMDQQQGGLKIAR